MSKNSKSDQLTDMFGDSTQKPQEDFGSMLEASLGGLSVRFDKGDKVDAEVVSIGKEEVFVNAKGKDGVVPRIEVTSPEGELTVKTGDHLTLFVVRMKDGLVYLTTKASSKALGESIEDAFDFETPVSGKVVEAVNGGFRVEVMGKVAFCPMSQMDSKPITKPEEYIGKKFDFIISQYAERGRKFVISRRKMLDAERLEKEGSFMETTKVGDMLSGRVTRLEAFGAFVELESGVEGLVHISEIGWSRLQHPSEALQVGEQMQVKVLRIEEDDRGRLKISLSRKQAGEDPWQEASKSISSGQSLDGKIKEKAHFGWLVEVKPGLVGLLPKSALKESLEERGLDQKKPGDTIRVMVMNVNPADRRISLALPRDQDDQSWQEFSKPTSKQAMGTLGDQFAKLFGPNSGGKK